MSGRARLWGVELHDGSFEWYDSRETAVSLVTKRSGLEPTGRIVIREKIAERGGFGLVELLLQLGHMPITWEPGPQAKREFERAGVTFVPVAPTVPMSEVGR